jgi:type III pantothenate kinase
MADFCSMSATLCLDFGNTRLKAAIFEKGELDRIFFLREDAMSHLRELIDQYKPSQSILSSVVDHDPEIESLLKGNTQFHKLSNLSKLPFTIPVGKPETVGADRLAIAAAAVHYFPGKNNLAIVLGSCVTYNFITAQNELTGGSISPGMHMRFRALHEYTAKLPLVKGDWNVPVIGYDTLTNIQSGVVIGLGKEIDGIIDEYKNRFGNFNVLLTGGDLPIIAPHLKNKIFADPELIFKGLYAICQLNHA